jgi:hypothetical protein
MMPSSRWLQLSYVCGSYDKVFLLGALSSTSAHPNHSSGVARSESETVCRTGQSVGLRPLQADDEPASSSWSQAIEQNLPEWAPEF